MTLNSKIKLTEWARQSPHLWLFLDYDGTLAEFAPTPEHIEPDARVIQLLERLADRPGIRVTVLSGRRLAHIRQLLPVTGIILAGTYGIELLSESGETINLIQPQDVRPALDMIKPEWERLIQGKNGFFLEDKDWALALHARFANDQEAEELIGQALEAATICLPADRFRVLGGHKFLEIAPRLASKRESVAYLLETYPLPEAQLLYIGDDDKDEEAFPLIHAHGGMAVKVRQASQASQPTDSDLFFQSPAETLEWLERLLAADQ